MEQREQMCTIRRQLWQWEEQERQEILRLWDLDNQENKNKPNKAVSERVDTSKTP